MTLLSKIYEESASRFNVAFSKNPLSDTSFKNGEVVISPNKRPWNDFGHRTRIDIKVKGHLSNEIHDFAGYIGFVGEERNGLDRLDEIIGQAESTLISASISYRFFTMLPSMEAYRDLIKRLGLEDARHFLIAINDVVACQELAPSSNWLSHAIDSDVFQMSFLRFSEAFYASKNAGMLLRGLEFEEFGGISSSLRINFRLNGYENNHDIDFSFDHESKLPKRMAVIIGENGVGKSQVLARIAKAALTAGSELTEGGFDGSRPVINRLLAFAPTNEASSVFPSERAKYPKIWYRRLSFNRSRSPKGSVTDFICQIIRNHQSIKERERWDIFIEAISALDNWEQISLQYKGDGEKYVSLRNIRIAGEQVLLERLSRVDRSKEPMRVIDGTGFPLSSGEMSFLKFAAQVSLYIDNGTLLLLDEPETHLHPRFISKFSILLDSLLALSGSIAIISTHSVYFVREVFSEQVRVIRSYNRHEIKVETPRLRTFGADVGEISFFVFGEDSPSEMAKSLERELLATGKPWEAIYEEHAQELSPEFLGDLKASEEEL